MKKYIKFVLGLILIVVMLNPIIDFFTEGKDKIVSTIKEYEGILSTDTETSSDVAASNEVEDVFIENLNKNLENKYNRENNLNPYFENLLKSELKKI